MRPWKMSQAISLRSLFVVVCLALFTEGVNNGAGNYPPTSSTPSGVTLSTSFVSNSAPQNPLYNDRTWNAKQRVSSSQDPHRIIRSHQVGGGASMQETSGPLFGPPPPKDLPLRFVRAGEGNIQEAWRRYYATLQWRQKEGIDNILRESRPDFFFIKQHYPHYFHLQGRKGEPVFYEQPGKTNFQALRKGGVALPSLLRHYTMVTEFLWQFLNRDDYATSIYIVDLEGIRLTDFVGDTREFITTATRLSSQHYPERGGKIFIINVPLWFKVIWQVVRPMVAESTLQKIHILRGKDEIQQSLVQQIPLENIPREYGGTSVIPLGHSPEERLLADLMTHNNMLASERRATCKGCTLNVHPMNWPCYFCRWTPARSY